MTLTIKTGRPKQVIDLTDQVNQHLSGHSGGCIVSVAHTTCAVTTADLDPGTDLDVLDALAGLLPRRRWRHPHNPAHAPDHILSSVIGPSVTLPVEQGRLVLGAWQRVVLIELDGPRDRAVTVTLV